MVMVMTDERMLTVADVAQRLQVSAYTVREWLRDGRIRGHRLGGTKLGWRVRPAELERFLASTESALRDEDRRENRLS